MRSLTLAVLFCVSLTPSSASAGLYLPGEPPLPVTNGVPLSLQKLTLALDEPRKMGLDVPNNPVRESALRELAELRARKGDLSPEERLKVSGLLLRLRDFAGAQEFLRSGDPSEQRDHRFLAHRALATFGSDDPSQALRDQAVVLDTMPTDDSWPRKAEELQKSLFRARAREARAGTRPETVDNLFDIAFVGPSGQYEAGKIAPSVNTEGAKLDEATALVQQLLFSTPEDGRLWWLLAELYNARGDVEAAGIIFDECVDARRLGSPDLMAHRRVVKAELARRAESTPPPESPSWLPTGPNVTLVLGIGGLIVLALLAWQAMLFLRRRRGRG